MPKRVFALSAGLVLWCFSWPLFAADAAANPSRVLAEGQRPADARLGKPRTLSDAYHPWAPPKSLGEWECQRLAIRERLLVSTGLWPLPPKQPLKPVIHGKIDRDDYTVEKVFFASHPGHYVTGNLYRPKNVSGKAPGVLCPHGHWANGRFNDAGDEAAKQYLDSGAEKTLSAAHFFLQARMVQLARMGCVVFHYDMVGNADSKQIGHASGFNDVEASLRLQNFMGLQTFNSLCALDFLTSLPDVDATRIGVTGASGGGTQTFMLCALDRRPTAAFPAVMVSTAMQGGCICENADYLRIGINNVAITALFAPKPLAMSGADDWTIDIETKGLPELREIYSLYGKPDLVAAKAFPQFKHNYNRLAREMMYNWFNEHLDLGLAKLVQERDFTPIPPAELSVFDQEHPLPADAQSSEQLRAYLTSVSNQQHDELLPKTAEQLAEYRRVVGTAARVMLDEGVPERDQIQVSQRVEELADGLRIMKGTVGRVGAGEQIPFVVLLPANGSGKSVLWVDGRGKSHLFDEHGKPTAAVAKLLGAGYSVISADLFLTGEYVPQGETVALPKIDEKYSGYTLGYNRPVLSNRVRDILTVIGGAVHHGHVSEMQLVGTGDAGPWALLAGALANDHVTRTVADIGGFGFAKVQSTGDAMFLPGALRYGGIGGLAALAAPRPLVVAGTNGVRADELQPLQTVYEAAKGSVALQEAALTPDAVVDMLSK
ncbi:MAG: alpha/beta hydrolase family protein [Pirellulales bacterium]